ncbi:MAG: hypothetical protein AB7G75_16925 [Candidatus Binatia bacterium]
MHCIHQQVQCYLINQLGSAKNHWIGVYGSSADNNLFLPCLRINEVNSPEENLTERDCFSVHLARADLAGQENRVAVIVHPERRVTLSVEEIAQIYLRRKRIWNDDSLIVPLNLLSHTQIRSNFSLRVLHQTEPRLANYWNRLYFEGIFPPATLASTEAIRRYVASDLNAIGYVPAAEVDSSVRVVLHLE